MLLSWDMGPTRFSEWTAGEHDRYLDRIVAAARAYPWTVYVRPWPEMNGDWQKFQPTVDVYAGTTPVARIWPGSRYVDVLGIDGSNWGEDARWGRWRSFDQIFAPMYRRLTRLHPSAPVWICEVSSKEPRSRDGAPRDRRRSKARWITDALTTTSFPRVRALVWFHARPERDWRVNSSPASLRAMRRVLR